MLTGRVVRLDDDKDSWQAPVHNRLIARSGQPLTRQALRQAIRILGDHSVQGRSIEEALKPAPTYEEHDRLELTLGLSAAAFRDPALNGWPGLGIAVQTYGKRALPVLRWLTSLAGQDAKRIPVRLVKGAYWDSEIKWAQERGLADYPVFTRKAHTDVSYLACVRRLLAAPSAFFPQFATHNAQSIASVYVAAGHGAYEFQRLHGMGEAL